MDNISIRESGEIIVETSCGAVKGERSGGVRVWRGIPYAAPAGGEKRFQRPEPPARWEGIRDATEFGPSSPQFTRSPRRAEIKVKSEDCLSMNIWAPAGDSAKRAVLFYVHGGSFIEGAGSDEEYEGTDLVRAGDVVLVTFNYRLGVLGFMDFSFLGRGFSSNCGLWDVLAALKWVNENIGAFGGDPGNVTLCGQSAGASCVCFLTGSDEAKPYFKRAILMSAVPNLLHTETQARDIARGYLKFMDIPDADALMAAPAMELIARQGEYAKISGLGTTTYAPCVDGELVKRYPIRAAMDGGMRGIPMLIGTTREEMSFALYRSLSYIVDIENIRRIAVESEKDGVRERIRGAYEIYGKRGPGIMFSDFTFRMPCVWLAEAQSGYADTWMYRFDYETFGMRISGLHSFHSCDVPFLFGNLKAGLARLMFFLSPVKRGIKRVRDDFRGDFLTFMKTGELPWPRCDGEDGPAKCYAKKPFFDQAVPKEVRQSYNGSEFKRVTFSEEGKDFPLDI